LFAPAEVSVPEPAAEVVSSQSTDRSAPVKRGRKPALKPAPTEPTLTEPVALEPASKPRGRSRKPSEPEAVAPAEVAPTPALEDAPVFEPDPPVLASQAVALEPALEAAPEPKRRGRPKTIKPEALESAPKARGRKPKARLAEPEVVLDSTPSQPPEAPKKLVRVRREAKEHVFSYQAALYNPYMALLEQIRATPGGVALRDLQADLDQDLLSRLGGRKGFEEAIAHLEQRGDVLMPKKGTIQAVREVVPVVGRLEVRADGSGYLTPDTASLRPMLIPSNNLLFAWHGDRVVARELQRVPQSVGEVIRVLERSRQSVTGTLEFKRGYALLRPDEANLPSLALEAHGVVGGTRLVVKPQYPEDTGEDEAVAKVEEVLGNAGSLESERAAVITRYGLPTEFSKDALTQAAKLGKIAAKDLKGRIDLRGKRVYSLPGLETALQIEPLGNGNVLLAIHYADSGYWIDEATPLEAALLERGAAVDLGGEVLPIVPPSLIETLSFAPKTERLSLSVLIETSANGDLVNYVVRPSVVAVLDSVERAPEADRVLLGQIGGLESALGLARRLCATAIAASDVMALYRVPGATSPELPAALERSNGFDPDSLAVQTLRRALTKPERIEAIHSAAAIDGLSLENPLSKAVDFLNLRILGWCATKLSQRKRETLTEQLPSLALPLKRLEQRAQEASRSLFLFERIAALHQTYPMRGVVVGISEFALEVALENGAIGTLAQADLGEEVVYTPNQWKTRLGRVFKPGSIVRVVLHKTRPATREAQLWLHQKENPMSRLRRRKPGANTGSKPSVGQTIQKRGVVVLGNRPRTEYPRPVRITARKLYFGEWSRAQFAELEGDNPEFEVSRPKNHSNQPRHKPQSQQTQRSEVHQPQRNDAQRNGQARRPHPAPDASRRSAPDVSRPAPDQARASRIEALRQRQMQALERNANRASAAPAPVSPVLNPQVSDAAPAQVSSQARRNRRRGGQRKPQVADSQS
jgi:exoribonuclease R